MDFKSVRKRIMGDKKTSRGKKNAAKVRVERTVGVVLVVLMGAAAMMLAARRPEVVTQPAMTSKVVAPADDAAGARASASYTNAKATTAKNASGNAVISTPVTITGCLEQDDDVFKLKNTEGADAPQSRSWKSGFLKKRPSTITVVDASHRWKLEKHVGERIAVSGSLVEHEVTLKSLSRVTASCS